MGSICGPASIVWSLLLHEGINLDCISESVTYKTWLGLSESISCICNRDRICYFVFVRATRLYVQVFVPVPVVCLYKVHVVYGRLMDAKTWPLFSLYILRFIYFQKVFIPALRLVQGHTVKSTVDRLTSFRAQLSRANKIFAVSRNNDVSRTGETYEFIYFLKKKRFCTLCVFYCCVRTEFYLFYKHRYYDKPCFGIFSTKQTRTWTWWHEHNKRNYLIELLHDTLVINFFSYFVIYNRVF